MTCCVFLLPLGGSTRRNKHGKEYRSALSLHKVVSQPFHGSVQCYYHVIYDIAGVKLGCKNRIKLERQGLEKEKARKRNMSIAQGVAALVA